MNTRQAEPTQQGRHLPGQDHYRTPGPPGRRRGNSEQNKQYLKLQYLPNTNLLFIPPLAGFFFAYSINNKGAKTHRACEALLHQLDKPVGALRKRDGVLRRFIADEIRFRCLFMRR